MNDLFDELSSSDDNTTPAVSEKKDNNFPKTINDEEDELEKTMEIEVLDLNFGSVSNEIDNIYENKKSKKRKVFLPITIYEDHIIQRTFVNCSILGFITLFFSYGEIIYILTHI